MENKEITQPSMGSNELGSESSDTNLTAKILAGTDTQLHIAAKGGKRHKKNKNINDDGKDKGTPETNDEFLKLGETDE